jgi:hypothetical protein
MITRNSLPHERPLNQAVKPANALIARLTDNFPAELRELAQWVVWRYEAGPNGKPTKVPYAVAGYRASSTDPRTWSTFAAAATAYANGGYNGLMVAVTEHDPYVGVDLDKCMDRDGIEPQRLAWVTALDSYTEITPSNAGLRVWIRGVIPGERKRSTAQDVEIYETGRFFTVTGNRLAGTPTTINSRQKQLTTLYHELFPQPTTPAAVQPTPAAAIPFDDRDLLERMFNARNGADIRALWQGDLSGYNDNASSADQALCNHLAFWTARDAGRMDRLFRQSGLMRKKWDQRARSGETYGQGTIRVAIEATTQTYDPHRGGGGDAGGADEQRSVDVMGTLNRARAWIKAHSFAPYIAVEFLAKDGTYRTEMTDRRVADALLDVLEERRALQGFISLRDIRRRAGVGSHTTVKRAMARLMGWFVALSDHEANQQDGAALHYLLTFRADEPSIFHNPQQEGGWLICAKSPFTAHKAHDAFNAGGNREMRNAALRNVIGRAAVDVLIQLEGYDGPRRAAWADYRLCIKELTKSGAAITPADIDKLTGLAAGLVDAPESVPRSRLAHIADSGAGVAVLAELGALQATEDTVCLAADYGPVVNAQVASLGPAALLMIDTSSRLGDLTYREFEESTGLKYGTLQRSMVKLLSRGIYTAERAGMEKRFTLNTDWLSEVDAQTHTMRTNGLYRKREIADASAMHNYYGFLLEAAPPEEKGKIKIRRDRAFERLMAAVALEAPQMPKKLDFTIAMRLSGARIPQAPAMPAPGDLAWFRLTELTGKALLTADEFGELQALDRVLGAGVNGRYGAVAFDRN